MAQLWCGALNKPSSTNFGLPELRRLCIRRQLSVAFALPNGIECSINHHGATVVDGEAGSIAAGDGFENATQFRMLSPGSGKWRPISRNALERLASEMTGTPAKRISQRER